MVKKPAYDKLEQMIKELNQEAVKRKQAEEELRESEKRYRSFLNNIVDGAYETDDMVNVRYANEAVEKIIGKPLKDIIGKAFLPLFTKASQTIALDAYSRSLKKEDVGPFELEFTNGTVCQFKNRITERQRWKNCWCFLESCEIFQNRSGRRRRFERRITSLEMRVDKRTAELRKTTEQLNSLMNATTDTVFLIDLKGYVVAANAMTAKRFGMTQNQFFGTCTYGPYVTIFSQIQEGHSESCC